MLQWFTSYNDACCSSCPLHLAHSSLADYPAPHIDTSHHTSHYHLADLHLTLYSHPLCLYAHLYINVVWSCCPGVVFVYTKNKTWMVAWHNGRTSVFDRRTFAVLRSTCSWYQGFPWTATGNFQFANPEKVQNLRKQTPIIRRLATGLHTVQRVGCTKSHQDPEAMGNLWGAIVRGVKMRGYVRGFSARAG